MKCTNGQRLHGAAASCTHVEDLRVGSISNAPAGLAQTPAKVRIFPVEKVTLVEAADLVERIASYQDARAAHPID